jgi:hypothetical protein
MQSRPAGPRLTRTSGLSAGTIVLLVLLAVVWSRGTFDRALYPLHLNAKACAQNAFGATFCGKDLDEYRRTVVDPLRRRPTVPKPAPLSKDEIRSARYDCRIGLQSGCDLLDSFGVSR